MASIDLIKASNGAGDAVQATVTSARVIGATTLKVNDVTNFPTGQFIGTTGTIDSNGVFDPATLTVFTAHLSGADVEIDTIAPGYADLGNTNGQVLVIKPNTLWADNVADTLAVSHNTDGTIKNNIVTTAKIADKAVTLPKLNGGSTGGALLTDASGNVTGGKVTADKIDFGTLQAALQLGYSQVTSSFITSSSTATIIPGTSITFNIPSTGVYFISMGVSSILGPDYASVQARIGSTILTRLSRSTVQGPETPNQYIKTRITGTPNASVTINLYLDGSGTGQKVAAANADRPLFVMASII